MNYKTLLFFDYSLQTREKKTHPNEHNMLSAASACICVCVCYGVGFFSDLGIQFPDWIHIPKLMIFNAFHTTQNKCLDFDVYRMHSELENGCRVCVLVHGVRMSILQLSSNFLALKREEEKTDAVYYN